MRRVRRPRVPRYRDDLHDDPARSAGRDAACRAHGRRRASRRLARLDREAGAQRSGAAPQPRPPEQRPRDTQHRTGVQIVAGVEPLDAAGRPPSGGRRTLALVGDQARAPRRPRGSARHRRAGDLPRPPERRRPAARCAARGTRGAGRGRLATRHARAPRPCRTHQDRGTGSRQEAPRRVRRHAGPARTRDGSWPTHDDESDRGCWHPARADPRRRSARASRPTGTCRR